MARSALLYVCLVFFAGTVLGILRRLVVEPLIGPLPAVLLELPLMLALSWLALKLALFIRPVDPEAVPRLAMGALAFGLLMLAEFLLSRLFTGADLSAFLRALVRPEGMAGLTGQAMFGLMPFLEGVLIRRRPPGKGPGRRMRTAPESAAGGRSLVSGIVPLDGSRLHFQLPDLVEHVVETGGKRLMGVDQTAIIEMRTDFVGEEIQKEDRRNRADLTIQLFHEIALHATGNGRLLVFREFHFSHELFTSRKKHGQQASSSS